MGEPDLVMSVRPTRLYRYRYLGKDYEFLAREMEAIKRGYLYCAPFYRLNDPMEGVFTSSKLLRRSPKYHAIRDEIISIKANLGICSFSEVHDHPLMWAHYADEFRGICVGYRLGRLFKRLKRAGVNFVRMYYNEAEPTVPLTTKEKTTELAKKVLSYKNYRWLYEREWRMFARQGPVTYEDIKCVSHVYLGSRMGDDQQREIVQTLTPLGIRVSRMSIKKYFISFEEKRMQTSGLPFGQ